MRKSEWEKLKNMLDNGDTKEKILETLEPRRRGDGKPEGGISLSEATREYKIPNGTLSRWANKGWLRVIKRTPGKVYVAKDDMNKIADIYKTGAGRGTWVIKKMMESAKV